MKLKVISSSSSGNFYLLTSSKGNNLLIECGIKFEKMCEHIASFRNVVGCCQSHFHNDHSKARNDLIKRNIKVFSTDNIQPLKWFNIKDFEVMAIPTQHNIECFSFLIKCDNKNIFFATDTYKINVATKQSFDLVMIECNYSEEIINDYFQKGIEPKSKYYNHLSNEQAKTWLDTLPNAPQKVLAIHISDDNNSESSILSVLKNYNVIIAKKGVEINL